MNATRSNDSPARFSAALFGIFGLIIFPISATAAKSLEELKFELETHEIALAKPLKDLGARYEAELQKLWESSGREGELATVLAADKELKRFRAGKPVEPVDDPSVKRLLDIYLKTKADLEEKSRRGRAEVYAAYLRHLKELEVDLTKGGKLDEAIEIQNERKAAFAVYERLRDHSTYRTGFKMTGRFHYFIDDDVWLYLNGKMISHRHRKKAGISVSGAVEVAVGDRIFAHVQNAGGAKRFRLAFLSEDGRHLVQFKAADFTDLFGVLKKHPDFTEEHLRDRERHPAVQLTDYPNNPFEFENNSEWVWGNGGFSSLAAVISPEMCQSRAADPR